MAPQKTRPGKGSEEAGTASKGVPVPPLPETIIITGVSGSGKGTVLKALEDLGFFAVDNLPVDFIETFVELNQSAKKARRAAIVADVREGQEIRKLPGIYQKLRRRYPMRLVFLDADDDTLVRRFSETRRPHPLGAESSVQRGILAERRLLAPIRKIADPVVNTSRMTGHLLRKFVTEAFSGPSAPGIRVAVTSFGFKHGAPADSDLVFDVRFLPNPNYVPEFKKLTGKNAKVAQYVRNFPQTQEFLDRLQALLLFLMPHYVAEGKSYLTISFGCTGGRHRSVMMAEETHRVLRKAGYLSRIAHRDIENA